MNGNGQPDKHEVLSWPGRVLSADDLRRHLNGQRELVLSPNTVITPLAADQLRAGGIRITRNGGPAREKSAGNDAWGYAQEQPQPMVASVIQALERDGLWLKPLQLPPGKSPWTWARALADCLSSGECQGGMVFCQDPGLVCCVANKVPGLRAAGVSCVAQVTRALLTMGANLLAMEIGGQTFFELKQMVRCLAKPAVCCPPGLAPFLQELDGHAHR